MGKLKIKKLNNQGSTFVLALLVIMLLTTLALALASASIGNMTMKSIDRGSKNTFYTSESLLDEIRAGIGHNTVRNLASAYESVLTNIIDSSTGVSKVVDNNEANEQFKQKYIENVLYEITKGQLAFGSGKEYVTSQGSPKEEIINKNVKEYVTSYILGYDKGMAEVTSIGNVYAYKNPTDDEYISYLGYESKTTWSVIVKDVAVSYKEKKNGETYFSNVTIDLEIEYPDMMVDFTTTNRLTDFAEFSLIADDSIIMSGQRVNVSASVYAGNLIEVAPSAAQGSEVRFNAPTDSNINVVCGGNEGEYSGTIRVGGDLNYSSEAHFQGVNIWCTNIATRRKFGDGTTQDATQGATIYIGDRCNTYVKDDLSADAQKSNITVLGEYYGYSYEGASGSLGHASSSAIIVNGKRSNLNIGVRKLLVGGRAYIDIVNTSSSYMTGESLTLKASQDVYLIPVEFLGINYETAITNPMSKSTWDTLNSKKGTANSEGKIIELCKIPDDYFAKSYLASIPYTVKYSGDMAYVYFQFADNDKAARYIKDVVAGADSSMKETLDRYNRNLFGVTESVIQVTTPSSDIIATGVFMELENGTADQTVASGVMPEDLFRFTSKDLDNRYKILTHLLATIPWDEGTSRHYVQDPAESLLKFRGYQVTGELSSTSIIKNLIDMTLLEQNEYNVNGYAVNYGSTDQKYVKMAIKNSYTVADDIVGGIIVCKGNVTLGHDFTGLIIAGGDIILDNGATITPINLSTNSNMVEEFIIGKEEFRSLTEGGEIPPSEDVPFKEYFNAYKTSGTEEGSKEQLKIENVDYKDLVNFDNWRKYEDKTSEDETE